jgi:hypothetical protein
VGSLRFGLISKVIRGQSAEKDSTQLTPLVGKKHIDGVNDDRTAAAASNLEVLNKFLTQQFEFLDPHGVEALDWFYLSFPGHRNHLA